MVDHFTTGSGAVDQVAQVGALHTEHGVDGPRVGDIQIGAGLRLGEIHTEAIQMGLDQYVQSGHSGTGINLVLVAVALCQIAPDLGIYAEGDKIAFRLAGVGHGGRDDLGRGDSDNAVGGHNRAVPIDGLGGAVVCYLVVYSTVGGNDVSTGFFKGNRHGTVLVGGQAVDCLELPIDPGAYGDTTYSGGRGFTLAHTQEAGELQGQITIGFDGCRGFVEIGVPVSPVLLVLQNGGVQVATLFYLAGGRLHTLEQGNIVHIEEIPLVGDTPKFGYIAGTICTGGGFVAAGAVCLMCGFQGFVYGENAIAIQVLNGDRLVSHGIAI